MCVEFKRCNQEHSTILNMTLEIGGRRRWREMQEAGAKRKQIAERKGQYHHGVPVITVIVDGGWSPSYRKHTFLQRFGRGSHRCLTNRPSYSTSVFGTKP
jgi:hypothetical protein